LPLKAALCFQWSESLNSNKARLIWLSISTLLLFTYSAFSLWLPHYVENQYKQSNSRNLDERISLIEQAIEKAESDAPFDKAQVVNIFESTIESEKSTESYISKIVNIFTTVSSILIGVLLIHLASLISLFQSLVKNKT
jgi:hypothetical protein